MRVHRKKRSAKQKEIMTLVVQAASRGRELPFDELRTQLSVAVSKQNTLAMLKILEDEALLVKRYRARASMTLRPTAAGFAEFSPKPSLEEKEP